VQLFERRVLTYNPANPPATQVEMGNVGRHYYNWRYANLHAANLDANYSVKIMVGSLPARLTHVDETVEITNATGQPVNTAILHAPWHHWDGVLTLTSATVAGKQAGARWREEINLEIALPGPLAAGSHVSIALSLDLSPRPVG